jgi:hypothetical protein
LSLGKAYLAYGISDGSVGLVVVTQTLRPIPNESAFGEDYNVELLHEPHSHRPSDSDGRSITALSWIELSTHNVKWLYLFESFNHSDGFTAYSCPL